jgi:hypothetical protein
MPKPCPSFLSSSSPTSNSSRSGIFSLSRVVQTTGLRTGVVRPEGTPRPMISLKDMVELIGRVLESMAFADIDWRYQLPQKSSPVGRYLGDTWEILGRYLGDGEEGEWRGKDYEHEGGQDEWRTYGTKQHCIPCRSLACPRIYRQLCSCVVQPYIERHFALRDQSCQRGIQ